MNRENATIYVYEKHMDTSNTLKELKKLLSANCRTIELLGTL